jgi:hypothetical protein
MRAEGPGSRVHGPGFRVEGRNSNLRFISFRVEGFRI